MIATYPGAVCATTDGDLFFSELTSTIEYTKDLCNSCAVLTKCRDRVLADEAGTTGPLFGVIGGLAAKERHQIRKASRST